MIDNEQKFENALHDLRRIHWVYPNKTLGQLFLDAVDNDKEKLAVIKDQDLIDQLFRKTYSTFVEEHKNGKAR